MSKIRLSVLPKRQRQNTGKVFLRALSCMSDDERQRLSRLLTQGIDWEWLLTLADFHEVGPVITHSILGNRPVISIPQPYLARMNQIKYGTLYRNTNFSSELRQVLAKFAEHAIPVITLKGTVLSELLYANPGLRKTADIDILVRHDQLVAADSLLVNMGYRQLSSSEVDIHPFHMAPYYKRSGGLTLFVEVHWTLDDPRLANIPVDRVWERAQRVNLDGTAVAVLSPEDMLLFLANQFSKEAMRLKLLGDIAGTVKKYGNELHWDYIIESARSWEIATPVFYSLKRASDLLGAPVPSLSLEALRPQRIRWFFINLLACEEVFLYPVPGNKLREETSALVRGLMVKHPYQSLAVLSRYRGKSRRFACLRSILWIGVVFGYALGRTAMRLTLRNYKRSFRCDETA